MYIIYFYTWKLLSLMHMRQQLIPYVKVNSGDENLIFFLDSLQLAI